MNCLNCDDELEEVFEGSAANNQFQGALHIQIHKGYGQYQDQGQDEVGSPQGVFCNTCADALFINFHGIRKLLSL